MSDNQQACQDLKHGRRALLGPLGFPGRLDRAIGSGGARRSPLVACGVYIASNPNTYPRPVALCSNN